MPLTPAPESTTPGWMKPAEIAETVRTPVDATIAPLNAAVAAKVEIWPVVASYATRSPGLAGPGRATMRWPMVTSSPIEKFGRTSGAVRALPPEPAVDAVLVFAKMPTNWPLPPAWATPEASPLPGAAGTAVKAVEPMMLYAALAESSSHAAERTGLSSYRAPGTPKAYWIFTAV